MKFGNFELPTKLRSLLSWIVFRKTQFCRALKARPYLILLFVAIFIYGTVFSYFTILKHNVFQSYAFDLGIFNQAMYTTLHDGRLFYYTAELYFSQSGSYFAVHFSPILFLALPFYAIGSSPITLLVIQAFSLALGSFPLYLLAKELLKSKKAAFLIAIIYLAYPALQAANWYDFHAPAFLPLLLFSTCYFMVKQRWKFFFPCVLLTLMIQEQAAFTVFIVGAFYFWQSGHFKSLLKVSKPLRITDNLAALATLLMSVFYYIFAGFIRNSFPVNPKYVELLKATSAYSVLGLKGDPLLFPVYVILNPQNAYNALTFDFWIKILYVVLMFGPLLFIPFRSKLSIGVIAFMSFYLFSNYLGYYEIGNQYPLYGLPLTFVATIYGLRKFKIQNCLRVIKIMLVVTLVFTAIVSPLSPLAAPLVKQGALWYPSAGFMANENTLSLNDLVNVIPPNASVLTQNHVFPHVSSRINAYVLPFADLINDTEYLDFLINSSEYVLLDLTFQDPVSRYVLNEITQNNSYRAYALGSNSVLFKRDFQGEPMFVNYSGYRVFSAYKDLLSAPLSQIVSDSSATSEKIVMCPIGSSGIFMFGPYTYLLQGSYEVTFEMKIGEHNNSLIGGCDISENVGNSSVAKRNIFGFELKPNEWTNLTLTFTSTKFMNEVEFRSFSNGTADIYIDKVIIRRTSPNPPTDFGG